MATRSDDAAGRDADDIEAWGNTISRFFELLKSVALHHLSDAVRRRVAASDVAASTIRTAIRKFIQGEAVPPNEDLGRWLCGICVKKAQDAARTQTRKKRDVRRTARLVDGAHGVSDVDPAVEESLAMSKDIVRKYIQGQPDPIDREILALAIFLPLLDGQKGATAKEIRAVLVGHHKNVPSVRAIQVRIAKHRAALRSILELVEPDQRESPET